MVVYFATAFLVGGADLGMIRRNLNRKPAAIPPSEPVNDEH
jgi:putative peptidoglycan lipid II flippase